MPEYHAWISRQVPRGRATCCYIYGVERVRINYSKQLTLNTLPSRERTDVVQCLHSDQGHHHHGHKKHHHGRRHHEDDDERSEEEEVSTKDSLNNHSPKCLSNHVKPLRYFRKQLLRQAWKRRVQDSDRRSEEEDSEDERAPRHRHRKQSEDDEVGVVWSIVAYCDLRLPNCMGRYVQLYLVFRSHARIRYATFARASCARSICPNMIKQNMNARVPFASICWLPILEGWWGAATGGLEICIAEFVDGWG